MKAYHFLRDDMRAGEGNEPAWKVGETRTLPARRKIVPCDYGYHASPTLFDALAYAPGSMACIVEIDGDVTPHGEPVDKYAARTRTLVVAVDLTYSLRMFAADCAEHVLPIFEKERPGDDRPRKAIEAARAYARGEIDEAARAAAREAARGAAWGAAWEAAWGAAWEAARGAAWGAAREAARAAAWAAAWGAAWAAAREAAGEAARAAAWAAAREAARAAAREAAGAAAMAAERAWQRQHFDATVLPLLMAEETSR